MIRSSARNVNNAPYLQAIREKSQSANAVEECAARGLANIYRMDISDASALVSGTEFELQPYDVVYVTAGPIECYNRLIRQLMPSISGFNELTEGDLCIHNWN